MSDNEQTNGTPVDDLGEIGNAFDPQQKKANDKRSRELAKRNLKATFGQGMGRFAILSFGLAIVIIFTVGVYNWNRKPANAATQRIDASAALPPTPQAGGPTFAATDSEANMRRAAINDESAQVNRNGGVYIPQPVVTSDTANAYKLGGSAMAAASGAAVAPASAAAAAPAPASAAAAPPVMLDPQTRTKYVTNDILPQVKCAMGKPCESSANGPAFATGRYELPDRSVKAVNTSLQANAAMTPGNGAATPQQQAAASGQRPLFDAGDAVYCSLKYGVNSDAARRDVVATCYNGNDTFAVLGRAEQSSQDAIDQSFTVVLDKLSRPGKGVIAITAVGVDSEGESAMADDVNKHGVRKYGNLFVAGALKGIGQAASIITGTTSATTVGNVTTTTTTTDKIDARRTAQMAAGQVGIAMGDTFAREAQSIKPTVRLYRSKDLTVVFLAPVYEEKKY
ncbi:MULTISPECIES: TrbI/VirB10 family protein [Cupriavidus]